MDKIINKYMDFILNTNPSKSWKVLRFFLHWVSLPIKLILIGGLGFFQIILKKITTKNRPHQIPDVPPLSTRKAYFNKILENLPLLKTTEFECYVNRVISTQMPNGSNHNPDHQCSRHSTYFFLMQKLGISTEKRIKISTAINMHMAGTWLARGFTKNPYENTIDYNFRTVSGDMLCGLNLAILANPEVSMLNEKFDHIIAGILENDYALREGQQPEKGDPGHELYAKLLKQNNYRIEKVPMKSARGMWQPGLETVGAQALTILAALRVAEVKSGNREAGKAYRKLLWKYGYGLLSLFPTAYTDKQRGYFNDHNCLIALYVLSKTSKTKLGKLFWKIPMLYVWSLSKHWYNAYFTGLVKDCYPESVSKSYIDKCQMYLYETPPNTYSYVDIEKEETKNVPVGYNNINADEFSPDIRADMINHPMTNYKIKTGLGFIACAIMIEDNPKDLLENDNI